MKLKVKATVKQFMKLVRTLDPTRFSSDDADRLEEMVWLIRDGNFEDFERLSKRLKAKLVELQVRNLEEANEGQ